MVEIPDLQVKKARRYSRVSGHDPRNLRPVDHPVESKSTIGREKLAPVSPDRTAVLTYLADDPSFSNVTQKTKSVGPRVTTNAEQVIALDPDLIVSGVTRAECLKSLTQAQ